MVQDAMVMPNVLLRPGAMTLLILGHDGLYALDAVFVA